MHLITLPSPSRWLKVATQQSSICHGSGALISAITSGVTWRPARSARRSSRIVASMYGHRSRLDDVAAADQTGDGRLFAASP